MKTWIVSAAFVGTLGMVTPLALASDSLQPLQHHHTRHQQSTMVPVAATPAQPVDAQSIHRFDVKSSVQVSREVLRDAYQASQDAYTKKLQKYAKCSEKNAEKAILAEHPGMKIGDVQLRNIRTNLVYLSVVADDDDRFLVVIDAGNGSVLMDKPLASHHEKVFAEGGDH
jgi:uncharacterized membrane protein YkoI